MSMASGQAKPSAEQVVKNIDDATRSARAGLDPALPSALLCFTAPRH